VGNTLFRNAVAEHLERYKCFQQAKDRHGMGLVVQEIIDQVHKVGGRFIDQNWRGVVSNFATILSLFYVTGEHLY
jgi:hypothetical protein